MADPKGGDGGMSLTVLKACGEFDSKVMQFAEIIKRQNGLVPGLKPSSSREHTQSVIYLKVVGILETFTPPRLPPHVYYPRLVKCGDTFLSLKEYRLARTQCFERYLSATWSRPPGSAGDENEQLVLSTRGKLGIATCNFYLAMERDPELRQPSTVQEIVLLLVDCRKCCQAVQGISGLYWLVYNSTITIFTLCSPLLAHGYSTVVVEFLIFAALCMEAQVPLNMAKYLPWRVRLYSSICQAYEESKMSEDALSFAERGLQQVQKLMAVEGMDPVPPPADVKKLLAAAELEMVVCVVRVSGVGGEEALEKIKEAASGSVLVTLRSVLKASSDHSRRTLRHIPPADHEQGRAELLSACVSFLSPTLETFTKYFAPPPAEPAEGDGEGGEEGGEEGGGGEAVSEADYEKAAGEVPLVEAVQALKHTYNMEQWESFKVLLDATAPRLQREQCPPALSQQLHLLAALYSLEYPDDRPAPPSPYPPPSWAEPPAEARVRKKLLALSSVSVVLSDLVGSTPMLTPEPAAGPDLFADAALLLWNHIENLLDAVDASPVEAKETLPDLPPPPAPTIRLPTATATTARTQPQQVEGAPTGGGEGEEEDGERAAEGPGEGGEEADAVPGEEGGEEEGGEGEEKGAGRETGEAGRSKAEFAEGTTTMWRRTEWEFKQRAPTLRQLATAVMRGIHGALDLVQWDDALVGGKVALRLGMLLEKRGRNAEAVEAVDDGLGRLGRARFELLWKEMSVSTDWRERFAMPSISTRTAQVEVPRRPNEEMEQAMACLQVDLLHMKHRNLLTIGVNKAREKAASLEATHARERLQRTRDQRLYGTKSRKQVREEAEQAARDRARPVLPHPKWERELLAGCMHNQYEKAILLVEMARLPRSAEEREGLLGQAAAAISEAEAAEQRVQDQINTPPPTARTSVPPPPRLVMRSTTEIVMMSDPWRMKGKAPQDGAQTRRGSFGATDSKEQAAKVSSFALYCKEEGSGVAVSLNNVAFKGSGVPRAVGDKIIVSGLTPNQSYVFAVAAMDEHGHVIEAIGETSVPVVALQPLPTLVLWGHLAVSANHMFIPRLAKLGANRLYASMVLDGAGRCLWDQNPVSRDVLKLDNVERAPVPLLRLFAQILCILAKFADPAAATGAVDDRFGGADGVPASALGQHKKRLRASKKLVMAVYVAVAVDDQPLACRAAMQLYHLLLPLLRMRYRHPFMFEALAVVRCALALLAQVARGGSDGGRNSVLSDVKVRRVLSCLSSAVMSGAAVLGEEKLQKKLLEDQLEEELWVLAMQTEEAAALAPADAQDPEATAPPKQPPPQLLREMSTEERALLEELLAEPELRHITQDLASREGIGSLSSATVLPVLKGSPADAFANIPQDDLRRLEFICRAAQQAVAENRGALVEEWAGAAAEEAKAVREGLIKTPPVEPTRQPLPSVDIPAEELEEEKADEAEEKADAAERKDLEIQFIDPTDEQRQGWEERKAAREERAQARADRVVERREARSLEAAARLQASLLPRCRRIMERRAQRALTKTQQPWLAALTLTVGLTKFDVYARADPQDQELWPPEPAAEEEEEEEGQAAAEGEGGGADGEEEKKPFKIPKKPMNKSDPAYVAPPAVPGELRGPLLALRVLTQAATTACRSCQWLLMLNACLQGGNLVRRFMGSDAERRLAAPSMRKLADNIVAMLQHLKHLAEGLPPPNATADQIRTHQPPPAVTEFVYSSGIIHRMESGNRVEDDAYDPAAVTRLLVMCLECMSAAERWVSVLSLGSELHSLIDEGGGVLEHMLPIMLTALDHVTDAIRQSSAAKQQLASLHQRRSTLEKETAPGGRLMEGLRARAKERASALATLEEVRAAIADQERIVASLRFRAVETLPGWAVDMRKLREDWNSIKKITARDQSKAQQDLDRCRAQLSAFIAAEAQDAQRKAAAEAAAAAAAAAAEGEEGGEGGQSGEEVSREPKAVGGAEASEWGRRRLEEAAGLAGMYGRCVSMLREKREKSLLPPALSEYGEVQWLLGKDKAAGTAWNDALDSIFTVMNVGRRWRELCPPELLLTPPPRPPPDNALERLGVHNVMHAGLLAGRLSLLVYPGDLHLQLEYALFAAHLLALPFTCGLPHPQRAVDFAGYVPQELVPGASPLRDRLLCDPASLMDVCEGAARVLLKNGHPLEMLPLLSVHQFVAREVVKDPLAFANACAWKARACIRASLLSEAFALLQDLHRGKGLPELIGVQRPPQGEEGLPAETHVAFRTLDAPDAEGNAAALQAVVDMELPEGLQKAYSRSVQNVLQLARCEFLVAACGTHVLWPHPNPSLQPWCDKAEELLLALRESVAGPALEAPEPEPDAPEDAPPPSPPGFTRHGLWVVSECDLLMSQLLLKKGMISESLDKVVELTDLLTEHGAAEPGPGAVTVAGERRGDDRQHTDSIVWLECRARKVELLALQGRWGLLEQECQRCLQEMAEVNEQLLARQVMWCKVMMDVQQGQTDLAVDALEETVMRASRLSQDDHRTARIHAYLGDLQRSLGDWAAALTSYQSAERMLERGLAAEGLVQSKSLYSNTVCHALKVKLRIAQLVMAEEGADQLPAALHLLAQSEVLLGLAPDTPPHMRAQFFFLRARATRQELVRKLDKADGWGGAVKPEPEAEEGAEQAEEGEGEAAAAAEPSAEAEAAREGYEQVMSDLGAGLELLSEQGGCDQQMVRCVLLEAACLHCAQIVPGEEKVHLRRAVGNLKLAAETATKRKALVETAVGLDPSGAAASAVPAWVSAELQEVVVARRRRAGREEGEEEEEPEANTSLRSLVYLLLALMRERKLRLFEDDVLAVRIGELHKAMADSFQAYSAECHVTVTREQLAEEAEPEPSEVVGQWYKPADVRGAGGQTQLLLALGQGGSAEPPAEEEGEPVVPPGWVLLKREVDGGGLWEAEHEIVQVTLMDGEDGPDKGAATAEWEAQVHPKLGPIEVQGEGAQDARMSARAAAGRAANAAAMMVLGVPAEKAEEGGGAEEVAVDNIKSLAEVLSSAGLSGIDATLCSALYSWLVAP